MIVFDLACSRQHVFEGWFASGEDYERQQAGGLVRCPVCDDEMITRRPSARVSVSKHGSASPRASTPKQAPASDNADKPAEPAPGAPAPAASAPVDLAAGLPQELVSALREMVRNTENVGRRFPEEARKIHYEEVPARAIRGQATREEAEALRDEGIDFTSLPPILTQESH